MLLGIEIGGTKLQLGVGTGDGSPLAARERCAVDPARGALGILDQIARIAGQLASRHSLTAVGVGFGGPVELNSGRVLKSHHIDGWEDFQLVDWLNRNLGLPAAVANDCDVAGLAEATIGAGRGKNPVFYVTVGTGIGGGLIVDEKIFAGAGRGAAELGHLRPGLLAEEPEACLESMAAGWGIAASARARINDPAARRLPAPSGFGRDAQSLREHLEISSEAAQEHSADLLQRTQGDLDRLTARHVAQAAADGNSLAQSILDRAWQGLGWGIAQAITLFGLQIVVIGGGVSLIGEQSFFEPVRRHVARYVFPPFLGCYEIVPAALGEDVVVHGALALARQQARPG